MKPTGNGEGKLTELQRMLSYQQTYYSSLHQNRDVFFEEKFNLTGSFTERQIALNTPAILLKLGLITVGSAGFGALMGMFMSSFEFSSSMNIDTNRSTSSQLKQHYFGFGRFLKRQALHFARFGFFIGLIEIPIELVVGRVNALGVFFSGGMAAVL